MKHVRREHLDRAPPAARARTRPGVELRIVGHGPELERRVKADDDPRTPPPSGAAASGAATGEGVAQRDERVGREPSTSAVDDRRRDDGHRDAANLAAEVPRDHRLDLVGLRAELLRVFGRGARGPDGEHASRTPRRAVGGCASARTRTDAARDQPRPRTRRLRKAWTFMGSRRLSLSQRLRERSRVRVARGEPGREIRDAPADGVDLVAREPGRARRKGPSASSQKKVRQPSGRDA